MAYLNLILEITALPDNRYRISMNAPVGSVSAEAPVPFSPEELQDFSTIFSRRREGITRAQEAQAARIFGTRLFDFLIRKNQDLNAAYFASLERAGNNGLRIRLVLQNAGPLADLPWEFLRDPARDFLALSRLTPIVRYSPLLSVRPPVPVTPPIRALVMIAAPEGYEPLDAAGEWDRLQAATEDLQKRGLLVLERMEDATLISLQRRLRARDFHIFHYIGHSTYDDLADQGLLVFEQEQGNRAQLVSAGSLARELGDESTIRLVVLNSCRSAQQTSSDAFSGIASSLVQRGIPAVVAMQQEITDPAAKAFAEEFYRAIAEQLPIDSAISEGRRAIANRVQNIEWATPVLYMRTDDGVLFRVEAPATTRTTRPVVTAAETAAERPATPSRSRSRRGLWLGGLLLGALAILTALIVALLSPPPPPVTPTPVVTPSPLPVGLPDLEVTTFRIFPQEPGPGQIFRLSIGILNSGESDSGAFEYAWDASPRLLNAINGRVENVTPGASRNFTVTYAYGWWGTYDSLITVDDVNTVDEIDDRNNNRRSFTIEVDPAAPFIVDFSLLPTLDFTEPDMLLAADSYVPWNMTFGVSGRERIDCVDTPILFRQVDERDIAIQPNATGVAADCPFQALAIELAQPVGNAFATIIPASNSSADIILYSDRAGANEVFRFSAPLVAGQPVELGEPVGAGARIRRIEIRAEGQPVTLTTLRLLPPG
ncbi:MAG: CHAT domain-containing protein [Anaerolineae bacterium]|nr:CHAT domain-containing protein [Anaerolineae bacterium]